MSARRVAGSLVFVTLSCAAFACNSFTGADSYGSVSCTKTGLESCANKCASFGGTAWIEETSTCLCGDGRPFCGNLDDPYASCCDAFSPGSFCDTDDQGNRFCQFCHPCGQGCCLASGESCLNPSKAVCGVIVGTRAQSCAGGLTCALSLAGGGSQRADCCESIPLAGGPFGLGRSASGQDRCPAGASCDEDEVPEIQITLAPYELDRFEVTVGRFRAFVAAFDGKGLPSGAAPNLSVPETGWEDDWNASLPASRAALEADLSCSTNPTGPTPLQSTWTHDPGANESLPINCVTWFEAFAFCAWDGGRLPTEAEWESAAANGAANELYPWGETPPTPARAAYDCTRDASACAHAPLLPSPVGSFAAGASRAGHLDLAGNVSEWTRDSIGPYPTSATADFANITTGSFGFPVLRGGAFTGAAGSLRAAARSSRVPGAPSSAIGFRCAHNAKSL